MISIGDALSLLKVFWTIYKDVDLNQEECRRLHKRSQSVLERMEVECGDNVPDALQQKLAKFVVYVQCFVRGGVPLKGSMLQYIH